MRPDRERSSVAHFHRRVDVGADVRVNYTETALILLRFVYSLPSVAASKGGRVDLFPGPVERPDEKMGVALKLGSIVVTAATAVGSVGHCFVDAFAMLVAISGFLDPAELIG